MLFHLGQIVLGIRRAFVHCSRLLAHEQRPWTGSLPSGASPDAALGPVAPRQQTTPVRPASADNSL
eukprot:4963584-Pyramimonas_sp.AAC.1